MKDNFNLKQCSENDALEFSGGTYRVQKIQQKISYIFRRILEKTLNESLVKSGINICSSQERSGYQPMIYFNEGVDCEILKVGSNSWEKGKFKISVSIEFVPNKVEASELDSLRQEMNN